MGSTFTTFSGQKVKGFAGKEYSVPVYLQFVPGYCVEAVHSSESLSYKGTQTINTIIAVPHVTKKLYNKKSIARANEQNRYFPLMRTMHDLPSAGDPVLLCTIGKINYYLGPLNSMENNVTWNKDPNFTSELQQVDQQYGGVSEGVSQEKLQILIKKINIKDYRKKEKKVWTME